MMIAAIVCPVFRMEHIYWMILSAVLPRLSDRSWLADAVGGFPTILVAHSPRREHIKQRSWFLARPALTKRIPEDDTSKLQELGASE